MQTRHLSVPAAKGGEMVQKARLSADHPTNWHTGKGWRCYSGFSCDQTPGLGLQIINHKALSAMTVLVNTQLEWQCGFSDLVLVSETHNTRLGSDTAYLQYASLCCDQRHASWTPTQCDVEHGTQRSLSLSSAVKSVLVLEKNLRNLVFTTSYRLSFHADRKY